MRWELRRARDDNKVMLTPEQRQDILNIIAFLHRKLIEGIITPEERKKLIKLKTKLIEDSLLVGAK